MGDDHSWESLLNVEEGVGLLSVVWWQMKCGWAPTLSMNSVFIVWNTSGRLEADPPYLQMWSAVILWGFKWPRLIILYGLMWVRGHTLALPLWHIHFADAVKTVCWSFAPQSSVIHSSTHSPNLLLTDTATSELWHTNKTCWPINRLGQNISCLLRICWYQCMCQ